ncbi:MAG: ATP-binding protein [Bacteroidetes bacterium]|nr:ATP-binding protein [Bacteroidota bacterium]
MEHLKVESFGPIQKADIHFGDLTLLVGPQASGKSILIQLLKLLVDKSHVRKTLQQYNYIWGKEPEKILDLYFGEGMAKIWKNESIISFDNTYFDKNWLLPKAGRYESVASAVETLFYIPAQRILSVADGRPKTFMEFDVSAPYVLRHFSEILRQLIQNGMGKPNAIFPLSKRLKQSLRNSFNESIFHDGRVVMDDRTGQRKLRMEVEGMSVPFITWSAGQKEFLPLLLGFYWLCPPSKVRRKDEYKYVVIEEPEMGLHPRAIISVILQIIDMLSRDYKVIVSTHSPVVLEFAWAFNLLKKSHNTEDALFNLFNVRKNIGTNRLFRDILSVKQINTFYFNYENKRVITKDISTLDAGSDDEFIANWGGITDFASKAGEIVSNLMTDED